MAGTTSSAPFSQAVVNAMRKLYPEYLAEKSWDNTGLLLEAPFDPRRRQKNSALLTIDLTKAVADEAIARRDSIVIAYHPIIFRGLKSLTFGDTQQQSLLRLAAAGISVYSPHTAIDAAKGGLGDWLADIVTSSISTSSSTQLPTPAAPSSTSEDEDPFVSRPTYRLQHHPSQANVPSIPSFEPLSHTRKPIIPSQHPDHPNAGMGRIITLAEPAPLADLVERISAALGRPRAIPVAIPQSSSIESLKITRIAVCAGSGATVFSEPAAKDADLLITGEMSHHDALAATEKGKAIVALFHSNSERGFLHAVLKGQLEDSVEEEWTTIRKAGSGDEELAEALKDEEVEIHVSEVDRDPYGILISKE